MEVFQETRVHLDQTPQALTIHIHVQTRGGQPQLRAEKPTSRVNGYSSSSDEASFLRNYISTSSFVHFREKSDNETDQNLPQAVLCRILDDGQLLQVQPVDIAQDYSSGNGPLYTLNFHFQSRLSSKGILMQDVWKENGVVAFTLVACTQSGELYTFNLNAQAFLSSDQIEKTISSQSFCVVYKSHTLGSRVPYAIAARSAQELCVSLADGNVVVLSKTNGELWHDSFLTQGNWKDSVKDLITWPKFPSFRSEGAKLRTQVATNICFTKTGKHVVLACLDHTLRMWDVEQRILVLSVDLAGDGSGVTDGHKLMTVDSSHSQLLQILPLRARNGFTIVTYSPIVQQFSFWKIEDEDYISEESIGHIHPHAKLLPPIQDLIEVTGWSIESFHFHHNSEHSNDHWTLWLLVRAGHSYHCMTMEFGAKDIRDDFFQVQQQNCSIVTTDTTSADPIPSFLDITSNARSSSLDNLNDSLSERWLRFLFCSGKFTLTTLKTALKIYCKGTNHTSQKPYDSSNLARALSDRLLDAVSAQVSTQSTNSANGSTSSETELLHQWQVVYGVVRNLQKQQEQAICLSYDTNAGAPWIVFANQISPLRKSSDLEMLWNNRSTVAPLMQSGSADPLGKHLKASSNMQSCQLVLVISSFSRLLSAEFRDGFDDIVQQDALQPFSSDIIIRMTEVYERSKFAGRVRDDGYNSFLESVEAFGGFYQLTSKKFKTLLKLLDEQQHGKALKRQLTYFGAKYLVHGAQQVLNSGINVLLALLRFMVFLCVELEEDDLPKDLDVTEIYEAAIAKLKTYVTLRWLAETMVATKLLEQNSRDTDEMTHSGSILWQTIYEQIFVGDFPDIRTPRVSSLELLTYWSRIWILGSRLNDKPQDTLAYILGTLIKREETTLAAHCLRFCADDAWMLYLKGRLALQENSFVEAAECFDQALPDLASNFDISHHDTVQLLTPDEKSFFGHGMTRVVYHISLLFEKYGSFAYAAEFSERALAGHDSTNEQDNDLKVDLTSRLCTFLIKTGRFEEAFFTISKHEDAALLKAQVRALLMALLDKGEVDLVLQLELPADINEEVDAQLKSICLTLKDGEVPQGGLLRRINSSDMRSGAAQSHPAFAAYRILYALRIQRSDFKSAAEILWEQLQYLKAARRSDADSGNLDRRISDVYLALMNCLSLIPPGAAWLIGRPERNASQSYGEGRRSLERSRSGRSGMSKRVVFTLEDIRREWQEELDRKADFSAGRQPLAHDDSIMRYLTAGSATGASAQSLQPRAEDDVFME